MRRTILTVLFILVIASIGFLGLKDFQSSPPTSVSLETSPIKKDAPSSSAETPPAPQEQAPSGADTVAKLSRVQLSDEYGRETSVESGSEEGVLKDLNEKSGIDPGAEFHSLNAIDSCLITPESGLVQATAHGALIMKGDETGYAALMVKGRWYLRMRYMFAPQRIIIGKIYALETQGWKHLRDFTAQESSGANPCGSRVE